MPAAQPAEPASKWRPSGMRALHSLMAGKRGKPYQGILWVCGFQVGVCQIDEHPQPVALFDYVRTQARPGKSTQRREILSVLEILRNRRRFSIAYGRCQLQLAARMLKTGPMPTHRRSDSPGPANRQPSRYTPRPLAPIPLTERTHRRASPHRHPPTSPVPTAPARPIPTHRTDPSGSPSALHEPPTLPQTAEPACPHPTGSPPLTPRTNPTAKPPPAPVIRPSHPARSTRSA